MKIKTANGKDAFLVAAYDVTRQYGGPEEGGWWYDAGELSEVFIANDREHAETLRNELRETTYPLTKKRYSVLGGEDYDVMIFEGDMPPAYFPEERPHYE